MGNSTGVILKKAILKQAGISQNSPVAIEVKDGNIIISRLQSNKKISLNLDYSTWETQVKSAIKAGHKPGRNLLPDHISEKADKEWTWPAFKNKRK